MLANQKKTTEKSVQLITKPKHSIMIKKKHSLHDENFQKSDNTFNKKKKKNFNVRLYSNLW